jgi:type IV pilus assembly protein PilA
MLKALKKRLKDQRGLTLIELLAVVVILGIIAAIAVPSIGGLIEGTKKEAHIANAQQMVSAARLAVNTGEVDFNTDPDTITLGELQTKGFLEGTLKNPNKGGAQGDYDTATSLVKIDKDGSKYTYTVTLKSATGTSLTVTTYINDLDPSGLKKGDLTY